MDIRLPVRIEPYITHGRRPLGPSRSAWGLGRHAPPVDQLIARAVSASSCPQTFLHLASVVYRYWLENLETLELLSVPGLHASRNGHTRVKRVLRPDGILLAYFAGIRRATTVDVLDREPAL
eukprot:1933628-Pyramimonas_sp.AAC.1